MTNEEIKAMYENYKDIIYGIINQKKTGIIKTNLEFIDMVNKEHTMFTTIVNDQYVNNLLSSNEWETLLVCAFKLYRKAVHSL